MFLTRIPSAPATRGLHLERLAVQLVLGLLLAVGWPIFLVALPPHDHAMLASWGIATSALAASAAICLSVIMHRKVTSFPGIRAFTYVLPSYAGGYALVFTAILCLRVPYNRPILILSFLFAVGWAFALNFYVLRKAIRRFYIVPHGRYELAIRSPNTEWIVLREPHIPADPDAAIVADLRYDHEQVWEKMLAHAAVAGRPVYHVKQLRESLTGRVSIEHISENSFGSMLPNLAYRHVKRTIDLVSALLLLPVLAIPMLIVALLIRSDSAGPALFRQERMGYRGTSFRIFKFRTMHVRPVPDDSRRAAMTGNADPRITRIGRVLRRTRIDELPQIFNIIAGDMSWIGPRPEAMALSRWYEEEIPFYFYRHIVRPGITGWAQVNQGHVSDILSVSTKLHYDFYYIKNFSAWLDALIALRTVSTMLNGFGAR